MLTARCGRVGRLRAPLEILTLNGGDQLSGLHVVAFVDGKGLDPARNARADDDFIGIYRADELADRPSVRGKEVPAGSAITSSTPSRIKIRLRAFMSNFLQT